MLEILAALFIVVGAAFALVGSIGLVKLRNPMSRLHAPTKTSTLGIGALLIGSILHAYASGEGSLHELLVLAFLFVTAPITAHFLAKIYVRFQAEKGELPEPQSDETWAALDAPARHED